MDLSENGVSEMGLSLGTKNKYRRMNSQSAGDHDDYDASDQTEERKKTTRNYVFACSVFASLNSVLLGYDVGVMSGAVLFIKEDLNITEVQVETLIGILSVMSLVGSLIGGRTSDAIGRKWTIGLAAIVFQTGAAIMGFAPSFAVLLLGRILAGIGIGFGVMIAPIYIAEISPTAARGSLTSLPEIFINFGILLGYISNYALSGLPPHIGWRVMLVVGILPSVFIALALCIIPESPRWLVMKGRIDEARAVLLKTNANEFEVDDRLSEILRAAGSGPEDTAVRKELMNPSPALRRMLVAGCGIQCFQQITGIDSIVYYSPEILTAAGMEDKTKLLAATVAVGVSKTAFILVAIVLVDRVGRKPLLYASTVGMTICLLALGAALGSGGRGSAAGVGTAIVSLCGNVAFFSVGVGPVCWVLTSEMFPLRVRAQAAALGAVGNRVCSGLVSMSFLSVADGIGMSGTFFVFAAVSGLAVAFVYKCVPETKGLSLEEIEMLFRDPASEVQLGDVEHLVRKELGPNI